MSTITAGAPVNRTSSHASPLARDYRTSWAKPPAIRLKQNTPLSGAIRRFWPTMTESPGSAVTGDDSFPQGGGQSWIVTSMARQRDRIVFSYLESRASWGLRSTITATVR